MRIFVHLGFFVWLEIFKNFQSSPDKPDFINVKSGHNSATISHNEWI